jgi:transposase-like protein
MLNAITKKFPTSARQRCVVHKLDNVLSYVPAIQQEQIEPELKALFYQNPRVAQRAETKRASNKENESEKGETEMELRKPKNWAKVAGRP